MSEKPVRLESSLHQKIWGVSNLEPWFHSVGGRIGEVWFEDPGPHPLPILVKFIFTSERLSVQVHPDDAYARAHEASPGGKTEMMYVLRAEPGATLAAGFLEPITLERAREAAISGEIEHLLRWWPAIPGQVYFIPAGTVHALGAGITVCEISQNNPITYRLFDYGRPRELHLEQGLEVSGAGALSGPRARRKGICWPPARHFVTERLVLTEPFYRPDPARFHLLIALEGGGRLGRERFAAGDAWYVPAAAEPFPLVMQPGSLMLRTYVPAQ